MSLQVRMHQDRALANSHTEGIMGNDIHYRTITMEALYAGIKNYRG